MSGNACNQGVDELVFATGISNGGAMSQRLACTLPHVAAVAPVAGENQYATTQACSPPVPVLEIHGNEDPCWPYDGAR